MTFVTTAALQVEEGPRPEAARVVSIDTIKIDPDEQRIAVEAAIRATRMPMVITNPRLEDNPMVFVNPSFTKLTGYSEEEALGKNCRILQGDYTDKDSVLALGNAVADKVPFQTTLLNYRKDGTTFWNQLFLSPVKNDDDEVIYFFGSLLDVTKRFKLEREIMEMNAKLEVEVIERTRDLTRMASKRGTMLRELHHRMKNNLQMISSLISVQSSESPTSTIKGMFDSMRNRVEALTSFYELAPIEPGEAVVDVHLYISSIVLNLEEFIGTEKVKIQPNVQRLELPMDIAMPLGLIVNELVTNAARHAFPREEPGEIRIRLEEKERIVHLTVEDDGQGLPSDYQTQGHGLGLTVVRSLADQVGGTIRIHDKQPTRFEVFVDLASREATPTA